MKSSLSIWRYVIDGEDFVNFRGLLKKYELYQETYSKYVGQNLILTHQAWRR